MTTQSSARRPSVGIATCADAHLDDDGPLLLHALRRADVDAVERVWDDPAVDWGAHDLVVIRSTWDYAPRRDEFVAWAEHVGSVTALANPAPVVRWNTDKRYLVDLARRGAAVVPTAFIEPGDRSSADPGASISQLLDALDSLGDAGHGFVVKPAVSAGSKDTARYRSPVEDPTATVAASQHVDGLLRAGRTVMLQPYLVGVDTHGETGLVYFDGELSHGFRKGPLLTLDAEPVEGLYAPEVTEPRAPTLAEVALAATVLDAARDATDTVPLYARVDVVPGPDGDPLLLELELTEPSFFLSTDAGAADRVARAIAAAARR